MPTITLTPDSFKEISELKIANNGNFSKKTLTNNDEGLSETDEIVPLAGGNVIQTKDGKDTVVGKVEVDPNNKDQFVFKANDPKLTGEVKFDYKVKQASGAMPIQKATVELEILSPEEATKIAKEEAEKTSEEISAITNPSASNPTTSRGEAATLISNTYEKVLSFPTSGNPLSAGKKGSDYAESIRDMSRQMTAKNAELQQIALKNDNLEGIPITQKLIKELNDLKKKHEELRDSSKVPVDWKNYTSSLTQLANSSQDPAKVLNSFGSVFAEIEKLNNTNELNAKNLDQAKSKAQAVMLHAVVKAAVNSNLDKNAKYTILLQASVFLTHHGILPQSINSLDVDSGARNLPINFGHYNAVSATSFLLDAGTFATGVGSIVKNTASKATTTLSGSAAQKLGLTVPTVVSQGTNAAKPLPSAAQKLVTKFKEVQKKVTDLNTAFTQSGSSTDLKKFQRAQEELNKVTKQINHYDYWSTNPAWQDFKKNTARLTNFLGGTSSQAFKVPQATSKVGEFAQDRIEGEGWMDDSPGNDNLTSSLSGEKIAKNIIFSEDSLSDLYSKTKDNSSWQSVGMDLLVAAGTGAGVGTLIGGPIGTGVGAILGMGKFALDSWNKGRLTNPVEKFTGASDDILKKLAEFAGSDYSALTDYTPSSSYSSSSSTTSTSSSNNSSNTTTVASSGNPSPFACA